MYYLLKQELRPIVAKVAKQNAETFNPVKQKYLNP